MKGNHSHQKCFFLSGTSRESANKALINALAQELVSRGHQVVIIVDGQREDLVETSGNPAVYTWPSSRPTKMRDGLFLAKLIKAYRPVCMVAQFGSVNLMTITGWLTGVRHRIPWYETLSTAIDIDTQLLPWAIRFLRFRKSIVFRFATFLFANSKATKLDLIQTYHVKPSKIRLVYNSISDPALEHQDLLEIKERKNHLACIGLININKGQDILIKALGKLKDIPNLTVEFVGSGPLLPDYQNLTQQLGVEHLCNFSGSVPHEQVFTKFAQATASVVPSRAEAFGYVCIESLAVGTPVIGSNTGGIAEIIRDGKDGYLFEPGDVDGLASAIQRLLSASPAERSAMRSNARQRYLDSFEQNKLIKETVDWLESRVEKN